MVTGAIVGEKDDGRYGTGVVKTHSGNAKIMSAVDGHQKNNISYFGTKLYKPTKVVSGEAQRMPGTTRMPSVECTYK